MAETSGAMAGLAGFCRENPYTVLVFVIFVVAGGVAGAFLPLGESLSLARRILAGAFAGAFFAMFPVGARLFD